MKQILIIIASIFCLTVFGQAQSSVAFFQINNMNYALMEQFASNTSIEQFSTNHGGKQLGSLQTNQQGFLLCEFLKDNTPKFLLNRKTNQNPAGTNQVYFLDKKEFVASDFLFETNETTCQLTWNATVFDGENITFQIFKSVQQAPFELVKSIKATNLFSLYSFSEKAERNVAYKLVIVKDENKIRYSTKAYLSSTIEDGIKVYPTETQENLTIEMLANPKGNSFVIYNVQGSKVKEGVFNANVNTICINHLQTGQYILSISTNEGCSSHVFIKK